MKAEDLIPKIDWIIQDTSYTPSNILGRINKGIGRVAALVDLPDLKTSYGINTSTSAAFVALPSDYLRKVFYIVSTNQDREVTLYESWIKFLKKYRLLDETGSVIDACVRGRSLYYQGIPATSDILVTHYIRKPAVMADEDDEPDGIPDYLQEDLLVNFVCWDIFSDLEDEESGRTPNTDKHQKRFLGAIAELREYVGPEDGPPSYYDDSEEAYVD
jgi:hypothetical protein